jgi:hypothetical protein
VIERKKKNYERFWQSLKHSEKGSLFRLLRQFERGKFQHLNQYRNNKNARQVANCVDNVVSNLQSMYTMAL